MKYTAVVIGATGLVGRHLVDKLLADDNCIVIKAIVRRASFSQPKVEEHIIDFDSMDDYIQHIKGDVLFSCLGTTLAQAGSQEKQYLVDYTYQWRAAQSAAHNAVKYYILVSSPFAQKDAKHYYRRMKGELEEVVTQLPFQKIVLIKPNGLMGEREKERIGEKWAGRIFPLLAAVVPPLRKYQPIQGKLVASAVFNALALAIQSKQQVLVFERNAVKDIA